MNVSTHQVTTKAHVDEWLQIALKGGKTAASIESWADMSIPDPELHRYCLEQAERILPR